MQLWFLLAWLLALMALFSAAFLFVPPIPPRRAILATAAVAVVARLVPIVVFPEAKGLWLIDVGNFERAADAVLHGRNIYDEPGFVHPYLPLQMYVLAVMKAIADATDTSFFVWMRLPQAAADVAIAVLLVPATRMFGGDERMALRNGLLYALCPLAVVAAVYHGQFDAISVLCALGAVMLFVRGQSERLARGSALALGLGILQKLWPVFLMPLLLARLDGWERRIRYAAIAGGTVVASMVVFTAVFGATWGDYVHKVFRYQTPLQRGGGIIMVMDRLPSFVPARDGVMDWWIGHGEWPTALALLVVTAIVIVQRRQLIESIVAVLCTLFVFLPDNGQYHYLWIVPFGLLARHDLPVAIVVLTMATRYAIVGVIGGGAIYPPPWEDDVTRWLIEHEWVCGVIAWLTLAAWGGWILIARVPGPETKRSGRRLPLAVGRAT